MSVILFAGPTLTATDIAAELEASVRPPAARGDVLGALRERPRAIGLIDGYFDTVPSVWHKEVLWALKEGVWVFGAASMGAIRAAELAPFGMVGVGRIFRSFHTKELEDDDEVAVAHGPATSGYRALSEAMVNIRATLEAAVITRVLTPTSAEQLTAIAKALHYPERTFAELLISGGRSGIPGPELTALEEWLPGGAVNQKRNDAIDMLRAMRLFLGADPPPFDPPFAFEHTEAWEAACILDSERSSAEGEVSNVDLLEESQAAGAYGRLAAASLARALSLRLAPQLGAPAGSGAIGDSLDEFRRQRGLLSPTSFAAWLEKMELHDDDGERFFREQADLRRVRAVLRPQLLAHLADTLREEGLYPEFRRRALAKRRILQAAHVLSPSPADLGLTEGNVWRNYFRDLLNTNVPADLPSYAGQLGFESVEDLRAMVLRELAYRQLADITGEPARVPETNIHRQRP
jgi:hypothetical protein